MALDLVDLDERAPFAILFGSAPENFEQYQAYTVSAVPAYVGSYYRDLAVEEVQTESERYASYTVTGLVRNTGPEEAVDVQVVLTAYDPLNRVIAVQQVTPSHNVVPRGGTPPLRPCLRPWVGRSSVFRPRHRGVVFRASSELFVYSHFFMSDSFFNHFCR